MERVLSKMLSANAKATCGDPESFARGGPTLIMTTFFVVGVVVLDDEGRREDPKYHYKWVIIDTPVKRH